MRRQLPHVQRRKSLFFIFPCSSICCLYKEDVLFAVPLQEEVTAAAASE